MGEYRFNKDQLFEDCRKVYEKYPTNVAGLYDRLNRMDQSHPNASAFERKTFIYQVAAECCDVKLFKSCPFYAELDTGRDRNSMTSGYPPQPGIGCWMMRTDPKFMEEYENWRLPFFEKDVFWSVSFTDMAHHYADCENIIKYGFGGLMEKAIRRRERAAAEGDRNGVDFLTSVITACRCVIQISDKFADKAEELLKNETDEVIRENWKRIADTARRVPKEPPKSFYEALNTIWFTREICNALEGMGFAVIGHIDRLLHPFYIKDLEEGRLTKEEAQALIDCFIAMTDARWDLSVNDGGGTNATVMIGGCDSDGTVIYNEITRMVIQSFIDHQFANPKLQARVTKEHPPEYTKLLGKLAGMGTNVLSVFNDPVIIRAHQKRGKKLEDCRLYLAGGCQEPTLTSEVNCRAYAYLNLPQMLHISLFPEEYADLVNKYEIALVPAWTAESFDRFYENFIYNFNSLVLTFIKGFNHFEYGWHQFSPCPLFSATMNDCIENALDITQGGARYNSSSLSMSGFGTLTDSLYAIRQAVYIERKISMKELKEALAADFAGHEELRQYLLNRVPKLGQDNREMKNFAARLLKDLSARIQGIPNARGGYFEASLFSFYAYDWLKAHSNATADGRHYGKYLSRGINPSESTPSLDAATLLISQKGLDYSNYPGGAVLYMDLPVTKVHLQNNVYENIIQYFLENGGCMMDFNVVNREQLLEAQRDPENHRNLIVRVCGYSAPFYSLSKEMQDEVIHRTQR